MPKTKIAKVRTAYENLLNNKTVYAIQTKNAAFYLEANPDAPVHIHSHWEKKLIRCIAQMKRLERKYANYDLVS